MFSSKTAPRKRPGLTCPATLLLGILAPVLSCGVSDDVLALNQQKLGGLVVRSHPWYHRKHHVAPGGPFRNYWSKPRDANFLRAFSYMAFRSSIIPKSQATPARRISDDDLRRPFARYRVHWLGHATTLIQFKGHTVLTDPVYSRRVSPVSFAGPERLVPIPLEMERLPEIDTVILSHSHYDHTDRKTLQELHRRFKPLFLVHLNTRDLLLGWGIRRVVELDWWQYVDHKGVRFHSTPTKHFTNRGLFDRNEVLWGSWYLEHGEPGATTARVYFAGDTAYAPFFSEIGKRLGPPDLAIMPIGAYKPAWIMKHVHVTPDEAVQGFVDLGAERFLGMHWGTFELADELLHEPPIETRKAADARRIDPARIGLLPVGGSLQR